MKVEPFTSSQTSALAGSLAPFHFYALKSISQRSQWSHLFKAAPSQLICLYKSICSRKKKQTYKYRGSHSDGIWRKEQTDGNGLPKPLTGEQGLNMWMPSMCAAGMVSHLLFVPGSSHLHSWALRFDAFCSKRIATRPGCHLFVLGFDWVC